MVVHTNPALPSILPLGMKPIGDLTNGARILGLLSQPRTSVRDNWRTFPEANDIYAQARAMTGSAAEQGSGDLAFRYKIVSSVYPFMHFPIDSTNYTAYAVGSEERTLRYQRLMEATQLKANLYELRLSFHWPLRPDGQVGRSRQVFRTLVSSQQIAPGTTVPDRLFLPQTYVYAFTNGL